MIEVVTMSQTFWALQALIEVLELLNEKKQFNSVDEALP